VLRWLLGGSARSVNLNGFILLFSALLLHTIGAQSVIVLPGFVQGLIGYGGFSDKQAGFAASAEIGGMALATVVMMFLVTKISWRRIYLTSLLLVIIGNLASIAFRDFILFCALRFLVGLGAGALIALSYGVIGMTGKPDRNFGLCIMFVLIYGSVVFPAMPGLYENIGLTGILALFAGVGIFGLPFLRFMPDSGKENHELPAADAVDIGWRMKGISLAAVFVYFVANFAIWSYFFRIGVAAGISEQQTGNALAVSQILGIAGAFTTAVIGTRLGRSIPISIGIVGSIVCIASLVGPISAFSFGAIAALYNYVWNMTHPFLLGTMASFDRKGTMVVYGVAMQYLGTSAGPAIAALVITERGYTNVVWLAVILFAISLALILPTVLAHARLITHNSTITRPDGRLP
jgi:DHA1 family inner membrane transport protein